jgi:hypothetical protein
MRALAAALAVVVAASPASGDPLPAGTIGIIAGGVSGTGADAKRLGAGFQYGGQAAWQPMSTESTWGWSIRWATLFGRIYGGNAAQIESTLQTVQMDLMTGIRFRPWSTPRRYLTARVGGQLLRANEPIATSSEPNAEMHRAFIGGVASVGLDQYVYNFMLNIDVRYGLIGNGPNQLALIVGLALTGP